MRNTRSSKRLIFILALAISSLACDGSSQSAAVGDDAQPSTTAKKSAMRSITSPLAEGPAEFQAYCGTDPCPCQESPKPSERDGKLVSCTLEQPAVVQGVKCRATKSLTKFHGDGRLDGCVADSAVEVQGFPIAAGSALSLYPHGGVHEIWALSEPVQVDGVPCSGRLNFAWKGGFMSCVLAQPWSSSGVDVPAGDWIKIVKGQLYRWEMNEPATLGEIRCRSNSFFHPDGSLLRCELAGDQTITELELTSGTAVCFAGDGSQVDCETVSVNWGA